MSKVIVFLKNRNDPSSYYRLYQYFRDRECRIADGTSSKIYAWYYDDSKPSHIKRLLMATENLVRVNFFIIWDLLVWHSDVVVINRRLFPRRFPFFQYPILKFYLTRRVVYWDFDDNIIQDGEITTREAQLLEELSREIIVTNQFLKDTIPEADRSKVKIMPTTDADLKDYNSLLIETKRLENFDKEIRLLWLGTKNNLQYLERIVPVLEVCASCLKVLGKSVRLVVVCNKKLVIQTDGFMVENIAWTRECALAELEKAHIGLMPLLDNEYTKGKGGFKAVQYLGMGIPAIVSAVGYNCQVINHGENGFLCQDDNDWKTGILSLCEDREKWLAYSRRAREKWERDFNPNRQDIFWNDATK